MTPQMMNNKNMLSKGSPRFTGEKRNNHVSPVLNNCNNSSLKKGMNRYGSQSSMLHSTNFKKDDAKNELTASGNGAISTKHRQHTQRLQPDLNITRKQEE